MALFLAIYIMRQIEGNIGLGVQGGALTLKPVAALFRLVSSELLHLM